jgi:cytochrome c551/c552
MSGNLAIFVAIRCGRCHALAFNIVPAAIKAIAAAEIAYTARGECHVEAIPPPKVPLPWIPAMMACHP